MGLSLLCLHGLRLAWHLPSLLPPPPSWKPPESASLMDACWLITAPRPGAAGLPGTEMFSVDRTLRTKAERVTGQPGCPGTQERVFQKPQLYEVSLRSRCLGWEGASHLQSREKRFPSKELVRPSGRNGTLFRKIEAQCGWSTGSESTGVSP